MLYNYEESRRLDTFENPSSRPQRLPAFHRPYTLEHATQDMYKRSCRRLVTSLIALLHGCSKNEFGIPALEWSVKWQSIRRFEDGKQSVNGNDDKRLG
jgi:hypothetical protein